jgi:hypothetical protein
LNRLVFGNINFVKLKENFTEKENNEPLTWGLTLLGHDVGTSAVIRYHLKFQLDRMLFDFSFLGSTLKHF